MNITTKFFKNLTAYTAQNYEKALSEKAVSFDEWIRDKEKDLECYDMSLNTEGKESGIIKDISNQFINAEYKGVTLRIIPYSRVNANFKVRFFIEDILIFVNGELTDKAIPLIVKAFNENQNVNIVYGDEDIATKDNENLSQYGKSESGSRRDPYFKPGWSPNAFLNHFYFSNMVAVRRSAFRDVEWAEGYEGATAIYHTLLAYLYTDDEHLEKSVYHIDEILVHVKNYELNVLTDRTAFDIAKVMLAIPKDRTKISIVIPSSDEPEMLEECLLSLINSFSERAELEAIVVDNGSLPWNKERMEALQEKYGFIYVYSPMEKNRAAMINLGASKANGELLLLLNDDITFPQKGSILKMASQAKLYFTGAVGCKILFKDSCVISHAGIVNNRISPVFKLQYMDDNKEIYHGFNKQINNITAVTSSCLMIRKDAFLKVKGFNESFTTQICDVDFCFKLLEAGYCNTVCNNISVSSFKDPCNIRICDSKGNEMLASEISRLYTLHPMLKGVDPFYSNKLLSDSLDSRILPANEYEYTRAVETVKAVKELKVSDLKYKNACELLNEGTGSLLVLNVEYAGSLDNFSNILEDSNSLYFQGICYFKNKDNACYKKKLLLKAKNENRIYIIKLSDVYRSDACSSSNSEEFINTRLSGFSVKIKKELLRSGEYQVGMVLYTGLNAGFYTFSNKEVHIR